MIGEGSIDALKLDIEGLEIVALAPLDDDQIRAIKQITVEVHDLAGYFTATAADTTIRRRRDLWFFAYRTRGDVLLVSPHFYPLSWLEWQWILHVERLKPRIAQH